MLRIEAPVGTIDIVGTGGDGHNTYNVSTCAAFVAAGAGLRVAKHGNRSVSSLSGASDVLTALGVKIDGGADVTRRAITDAGVGFLWAPMHHAAMKAWAETRAALGVRTIFNVLGPISNPAGVTRQIVGVFARHWVEPLAEALRNLGSEHVWVVHGHDGLDELSTTGPTTVAELKDGAIRVFEVTPEEAGLPRATLADLRGGGRDSERKSPPCRPQRRTRSLSRYRRLQTRQQHSLSAADAKPLGDGVKAAQRSNRERCGAGSPRSANRSITSQAG